MDTRANDLLREARRRAGLSQVELAQRARVAQSVISAYENGRREPSWATLRRLIKATGLEVSVELVEPERRVLPDTPAARRLRRHRRELIDAAERRGATNIRVFGSVARGDDRDDSDVDLVVDLDDKVGLVGLIGLERELSEILRRSVDVVPARGLKPRVADRVEDEALPL